MLQKLSELEKEEEVREAGGLYAVPKIELDETMREIRQLAVQIRYLPYLLRFSMFSTTLIQSFGYAILGYVLIEKKGFWTSLICS